MRYVVPDLEAIAGGYPGIESVLVMDYRELRGFFNCGRLKLRCCFEKTLSFETPKVSREVVALKEYTPGWINEKYWFEIPQKFSDIIKWVKTCN